jgi:hypothetical protein
MAEGRCTGQGARTRLRQRHHRGQGLRTQEQAVRATRKLRGVPGATVTVRT